MNQYTESNTMNMDAKTIDKLIELFIETINCKQEDIKYFDTNVVSNDNNTVTKFVIKICLNDNQQFMIEHNECIDNNIFVKVGSKRKIDETDMKQYIKYHIYKYDEIYENNRLTTKLFSIKNKYNDNGIPYDVFLQ